MHKFEYQFSPSFNKFAIFSSTPINPSKPDEVTFIRFVDTEKEAIEFGAVKYEP